MKVLAVIPARYNSSRFPGKPLVQIKGKSMIEHVYYKVLQNKNITKAIVATDDQRILDAVHAFGGQAMMTSENHQSGTDRCGEVCLSLKEGFDVVINIQGDEPTLNPTQLDEILIPFKQGDAKISTLIHAINDQETVDDQNVVKVVKDVNNNALYFSRFGIPFRRDGQTNFPETNYFRHVGLYAFKQSTLLELIKLPQTQLEKSESLEQLRWLENGYQIKLSTTNHLNIGVDTPADLDKVIPYL